MLYIIYMSNQLFIGKFLLRNKMANSTSEATQFDSFNLPLAGGDVKKIILYLNKPTITQGTTSSSEPGPSEYGPQIQFKFYFDEKDYKLYKAPTNTLLMPEVSIDQIFYINNIIRTRNDEQTNNLDQIHIRSSLQSISTTQYSLFDLPSNPENDQYKFSGSTIGTGTGNYVNVNGFTINDKYGLFYNAKYTYIIYGFDVITGISHEIFFSNIVTLPPNIQNLSLIPISELWTTQDSGINIGVENIYIFSWRLNPRIIGSASILEFKITNPFNSITNTINSIPY